VRADIDPQRRDQEVGSLKANYPGISAPTPQDPELTHRSQRSAVSGIVQHKIVRESQASLAIASRGAPNKQASMAARSGQALRTAVQPALGEFRAVLAGSWSAETAYPGSVTPSHWSAGNPRGQCGVSSVWLAEVLDREYSIGSTFCRGSLIFSEDVAEDLLDHCWLEITAESGEELVLDLTCDQAHGFDRQIIFDSRADLDQEHVHYIPSERVDISDLPSNPVWPRYQKLLRNIAD
jgi:hypothetical protein